jgi:uncharacterized protein (UPF0332 family)
MEKANQAVVSAKLLLEIGDANGACNRAYYAMFDAARAALTHSGVEMGKTHKGVLNLFSNKLIKNGTIPVQLGRSLKHAETYRYWADYESSSVEQSDAKKMVMEAEEFVGAIQASFMGRSDS